MLDILVDTMVDTMVVLLLDTLEDMAITLASVRLRLSLRLMLDILVDTMVDTMEVLLLHTMEDLAIILASVRLSLRLMLDMLATAVDSFGKLLNYRRADNELFPHDELYTSHAVLNKLDTKKSSLCYILIF